MANNPYKNKVVYNGATLIDLTSDTVTADKLLQGYTAHDASGAPITGTATAGGVVIEDIPDSHGGTIKNITTVNSISIGPKTVTSNGTYDPEDDGYDGYSSVTVDVSGGGSPTLQTKTIMPTESEQTVTPDTGYDGLSSVSVGAISSSYVGTGIPRKSSTDLTASGATVTVPSGYYESDASKAISNGSATTPATTITANPSISVSSSGLITATASATKSVTPTVSSGYVSSGTAGTITVNGSNTEQLTTKGATTYTPTTTNQTIASGTYLTGTQTISGDANLVAGNIKKDVSIFGVTGTYEGSSSKAIYIYNNIASRTANSYGATNASVTVTKAGTYTISYVAIRGSSSGTMGTNLHIGSTSGTNNTTWNNGTYGQYVKLTGQSISANTKVTVYATAGNASRTIYVANLIIQEE